MSRIFFFIHVHQILPVPLVYLIIDMWCVQPFYDFHDEQEKKPRPIAIFVFIVRLPPTARLGYGAKAGLPKVKLLYQMSLFVENGRSHRAKTPPTQSWHALDFSVFN